MRIATATPHFYQDFKRFDRNLGIVDLDSYHDAFDVIIFTGGSDVSPSLYGKQRNGAVGIDVYRDGLETKIFEKTVRDFPNTVIVGVCRGLQFVNVLLGGTLVQDMGRIGVQHGGYHHVLWTSSFRDMNEKVPKVNSLHHQCIDIIGDAINAEVLAIEPTTGVIEAIRWNNKFIAVQFHPEWLGPDGDTVFNRIKSWIGGSHASVL